MKYTKYFAQLHEGDAINLLISPFLSWRQILYILTYNMKENISENIQYEIFNESQIFCLIKTVPKNIFGEIILETQVR